MRGPTERCPTLNGYDTHAAGIQLNCQNSRTTVCAFSYVSCFLSQCEVSCVVYTSLVTFNVWLKKIIVRCSFHMVAERRSEGALDAMPSSEGLVQLRTRTYLGLEPYLPASKRRWCREFVEMKIRNLQSLLVCPIIL